MNELGALRVGMGNDQLRAIQQGLQTPASSRRVPETQAQKALMKQARKLEGFMLQMLLSSMRRTVSKSKLLDGGNAEEIYTGMFDQAVTEQASGQGRGIGLAGMIYDQLGPLVTRAEQARQQLVSQTNGERGANGR